MTAYRSGTDSLHIVDPNIADPQGNSRSEASRLGDSTSVQDAGPVPRSATRRNVDHVILFAFIAIPFLAILAAIPLAWDRGSGGMTS